MNPLTITNAYGTVEVRLNTHSETVIAPIALDIRTGQATLSAYLQPAEARAFAAELLEVAARVEQKAVAA